MDFFDIQFLGTVQGEVLPPLSEGAGPMLIRQVDWNGDGYLDLLIFNGTFPPTPERAEPPWALLSDGAGGFVTAPELFSGSIVGTVHPRQIEIKDFNGDGRMDVFVADHGYDTDPFIGFANSLFLQNEQGELIEANGRLPGFTDFSHALSSGDIDGDGDVDLLVMNLSSQDGPFTYFLINDGDADFTVNDRGLPNRYTTQSLDELKTVLFVDLIDLNGDGHLDLFIGAEQAFNEPSEIILNDGDGNFVDENAVELPLRTDRTQNSNPQSAQAMAVMDLDSDGNLDIFLSFGFGNGDGGSVQILMNNGDGTYRDETDARLSDGFVFDNDPAFFLSQADVNGDGYVDIVNNSFGAASPIAWINDGEGYFSTVFANADITHGGTWIGALPGTQGLLNYLEVFEFDGALGHNLIVQDTVISTGPDYSDPALSGFPGFNEAYYLRVNPTAAAALSAGIYATGLEHYVLEGQAQGLRIAANIGNDVSNTLYAGQYGSSLLGYGGDDIIFAGPGTDTLDGGSGNDTASYEFAADRVFANLVAGFSTFGEVDGDFFTSIENLTGSQFGDLLRGDDVDNILVGLGGTDALIAGGGNDTLDGGEGNDVLRGNTGDDILIGGQGADLIDGGVGLDTADYSGALEAIIVDLLTLNSVNNVGGALGDTLKLIEAAIGSVFDDEIFGSSRGNIIDGGSGNDDLVGRNGNDILNGGDGHDRLFGGNNADLMRGNAGNDTLFGGDGRDILFGGAGFDDLRGQAGDDRLFGGGHDDALYGFAGSDELNGGSGDDLLDGGIGDDILLGAAGNDNLSGGNNDDYLSGGLGDDTLVGGNGADTYAFRATEAGTDAVVGLDSTDSLIFADFGYGDTSNVLDYLRVQGTNVVFEDQGVSVVFTNTKVSDVEAALGNAGSSVSNVDLFSSASNLDVSPSVPADQAHDEKSLFDFSGWSEGDPSHDGDWEFLQLARGVTGPPAVGTPETNFDVPISVHQSSDPWSDLQDNQLFSVSPDHQTDWLA